MSFVPRHRVRIRVRYAETDQMGVVYHGSYLPWLEVGRVELCRANGVRYRDMEQDGIMLAVAEVNVRYHAPARYDDEVDVEVRIAGAHPRLVAFGYEITHAETAQKLVTAVTRHVFLNRDFRHCKLPRKYFGLFGIE